MLVCVPHDIIANRRIPIAQVHSELPSEQPCAVLPGAIPPAAAHTAARAARARTRRGAAAFPASVRSQTERDPKLDPKRPFYGHFPKIATIIHTKPDVGKPPDDIALAAIHSRAAITGNADRIMPLPITR